MFTFSKPNPTYVYYFTTMQCPADINEVYPYPEFPCCVWYDYNTTAGYVIFRSNSAYEAFSFIQQTMTDEAFHKWFLANVSTL